MPAVRLPAGEVNIVLERPTSSRYANHNLTLL
jgi:hypothetical protein